MILLELSEFPMVCRRDSKYSVPTFASNVVPDPLDPLFWSSLAYVDRVWGIWQKKNLDAEYPEISTGAMSDSAGEFSGLDMIRTPPLPKRSSGENFRRIFSLKQDRVIIKLNGGHFSEDTLRHQVRRIFIKPESKMEWG